MGTGVAWTMRKQLKEDFLASNGTQTGEDLSFSLVDLQDKAARPFRLLLTHHSSTSRPQLHRLWLVGQTALSFNTPER